VSASLEAVAAAAERQCATAVCYQPGSLEADMLLAACFLQHNLIFYESLSLQWQEATVDADA
jgi:hypothetical protein